MLPAVSKERDYIVPVSKKKKKSLRLKYKNPDALSKKKTSASDLQKVINQFYKEKYDMNAIRRTLGSEASKEYLDMLKHLTELRQKIRTIGSIRTFLSKDFYFSLLNTSDPTFLTNDYLCLMTSLCIVNNDIFAELTMDISYLKLTSVGYYSNTILNIDDKDEEMYFKKLLIEDANLDFSASFPYLGYDIKQMKVSNTFQFQDFKLMIIKFDFKEIEEKSDADVSAIAKGYEEFVKYYNNNKRPVYCIYKINPDRVLSDAQIFENIVKIWENMKIYTFDKSLGNYGSKINLSKLKAGSYFVNTKCKPTFSMCQYNYIPSEKPLNIEMVTEYSLPCSVFFNICIQDPKAYESLPDYLYRIENIDAICQLSYVFSFYFGKLSICPSYTTMTYQDLYNRIKDRNGIFKPLQNLWNKFVQITRIFIEANGNRINVDKYNVLQKLTADWKSLFQRFTDILIDDKDMANLYKDMNFREYAFLASKGEYINTAILKITKIILNKTSAIDFKYEEIESLLRGILIEIFANFYKAVYDKDKHKMTIIGYLPINASPFKILGNIIGKINHREDISDAKQAIDLMTDYQNILTNFMNKNYNAYVNILKKDATVKDKLADYEKTMNLAIIKDMYKQCEDGLMDFSVIQKFGEKHSISISALGMVPPEVPDDKKAMVERMTLLSNLRTAQAKVEELKATINKLEAERKDKPKGISASVLWANVYNQGFNKAQNTKYVKLEDSFISLDVFREDTYNHNKYFNLNRLFDPPENTCIGAYENPTFTIADFIFGLVCGALTDDGSNFDVSKMIDDWGTDFLKVLLIHGLQNDSDHLKNGIYSQFAQLAVAKIICKEINIVDYYEPIKEGLSKEEKPRLYYKFGSFIPIVLLYQAALASKNENLKYYVLSAFTQDDDFENFISGCVALKFFDGFSKHIKSFEEFKELRKQGQVLFTSEESMLQGVFDKDLVTNIMKEIQSKRDELKAKKSRLREPAARKKFKGARSRLELITEGVDKSGMLDISGISGIGESGDIDTSSKKDIHKIEEDDATISTKFGA